MVKINNMNFGLPSDMEKGAKNESQEHSKLDRFLNTIGRPELREVLKDEKTPWIYWAMEIYRDDIKGGGGLGMLASDTLEIIKKLEVPAFFITPFYRKERVQRIENLEQKTELVDVTPEERGFKKFGAVSIDTLINNNLTPTELDFYIKSEGSARLLVLSEKNFGELYQGESDSDHRIYQNVALGVGGFRAMKKLGIKFPIDQQLNEAPTVFSALARLDDEMDGGGSFMQALSGIKSKTIYTNHTLVQAAEAEYSLDQFERFVFPNLKHQEIADWLRQKIEGKGGKIKLSTLAFELAEKRNGVSLIHAREASKLYKDYDGNNVVFEGVTNGISLERWADSELLNYYRKAGVLDEFNLPTPDFKEKLKALDLKTIAEIKERGRGRLRDTLSESKNQYNESIQIPQDAKIFNWKRRLAEYKRPGMIFERPSELAEILEKNNAYLVMAGKTHPGDKYMQKELLRILRVVDGNPILKKRVHFVQNYGEIHARSLAQGADVSLNTPRVRNERGERISTEACGTSWEKDVIGNTILISTSDGGVADPEIRAKEDRSKDFVAPFLEIVGTKYEDEVASLYKNMQAACDMLEGEVKYDFLKKQLEEFLPIISGSRMEADYLNLAFPKAINALSKAA